MKKLIWRLKEQPTSESLRELVRDKILTNEEAREILFSSESEEDRDKKSLESEIKFLRELVEKLSNDKSRIVEIIREVERPIIRCQWYQPYHTWCDAVSTLTYDTPTTSGGLTVGTTGNHTTCSSNFSDIKTF